MLNLNRPAPKRGSPFSSCRKSDPCSTAPSNVLRAHGIRVLRLLRCPQSHPQGPGPKVSSWFSRSSNTGWRRRHDPDRDGRGRLLAALKILLADKGIATSDQIAERIAITDRASPAQGACMVARAWTDPAYRTLLLAHGTAAAEAMDIPMRGMPPLGVLENTTDNHNLAVCTLCSCFPRRSRLPAVLVQVVRLQGPRGAGAACRAGRMEDDHSRYDPHKGCRFDRGLPLDGAAAAASRNRRLG